MLVLHRAERAVELTAALRDVVSVPLDDVFAPEIVSVPTRGMERWISQQLSHGTSSSGGGVCANVDFSPPNAVLPTPPQPDGPDPEEPWRPLLRSPGRLFG